MTTIKQLLQVPIGQVVRGFTLTVKTSKKKWQVNDEWMHQVLFMDKTGEMLADIEIGTYSPLVRGREYRITVAEVQAEEKFGKKLYVERFQPVTQIGEPEDPFYNGESDRVVRGKTKCLLVAGCLTGGTPIKEINTSYYKDELNKLVDFIMDKENQNGSQ